ncbi:MAG: N-acetyl-gamma-glutamyl-phosphate reductase [Saccharolobus sp.]|uniref:[LysW]-L-2-aminoadipate/[LysW]-L-glutamate phosphate reductase n=2 Tax=Saccharolobus shibatae TaxID=2286 RepID=A0A8F5GYJ4_9CREN|nr:N-acetyl-gamma-glutamyl-phosphate reductase [Saccharolobus shibatae]MCH4814343.1 N-acetyl-gamma-glutamyl-phosphate reductase [Saccharolobus shibatae]QXJ27249.1 N-acetyl-gamma-aminoadipyl-phosphate reductase N-acetyl-gamma-glutamyl-phosphate reductase [Saccharolobus shibatae B12]QXJ30526.1 N-acetyl-gamma-aminoadipyl-phosphate reductase N-acetyl-gamma-glutamyl-phosphate reductase [Saccharolobus shibatae]QXJ33572.1 N-acetyl-gamma-aminoadipyl-phosphate reductase, N-acetyl-gamma-glutamyl-phosphat
MKDRVRVAVVGGSGYTGGELLRILVTHPKTEISVITSREYAGKPVSLVHPNLRGLLSLNFTNFSIDKISDKADAIFLALPHGVSLNYVPKLLDLGLTIVDLSADFRLKNPELYKIWYNYEHPYPDLLDKAVYGLPELHFEELRNAKLIASPGCNATATILALAPVVASKITDEKKFISDVKVGSSEGGAKPSEGSHHPERQNAIRPYEAEGHRHAAEAEQELSRITKANISVSIVPHAVSSIRGALASAHTWLSNEIEEIEIWKKIAEFYRGKRFIRIVRGNIHPYPDPKFVIGSNFADIGFAVEKRISRLTAFSAIDNLMKGAAGQAVQAFNISMGFNEDDGLKLVPLRPA